MKFLAVLRSLFAAPLILFLLVLLTATALAGSLTFTLANSAALKSWIDDSGIYDHAVDLGFDAYTAYLTQTLSENGVSDPLEQVTKGLVAPETVRYELNQVFPPEWIKVQVETSIDSIYAFAERRTDTLKLSLDLHGQESEAQQAIADIVKQRVATLPTCPQNVLGSVTTLNVFAEDACVPQNISRDALYGYIDSKVQELGPLQNFGLRTLSFHEFTFNKIPPQARLLVLIPWAVLFLILLIPTVTFLLYFLLPGQRAKLMTLSAVYLLGGLVLIGASIFALFRFDALYGQFVTPHLPETAAAFLPYIHSILGSAYHSIWLLIEFFGALYLAFAILFFFLGRREEPEKGVRLTFMVLLALTLVGLFMLSLYIVVTLQNLYT